VYKDFETFHFQDDPITTYSLGKNCLDQLFSGSSKYKSAALITGDGDIELDELTDYSFT
jgi:hypothetical protein